VINRDIRNSPGMERRAKGAGSSGVITFASMRAQDARNAQCSLQYRRIQSRARTYWENRRNLTSSARRAASRAQLRGGGFATVSLAAPILRWRRWRRRIADRNGRGSRVRMAVCRAAQRCLIDESYKRQSSPPAAGRLALLGQAEMGARGREGFAVPGDMIELADPRGATFIAKLGESGPANASISSSAASADARPVGGFLPPTWGGYAEDLDHDRARRARGHTAGRRVMVKDRFGSRWAHIVNQDACKADIAARAPARCEDSAVQVSTRNGSEPCLLAPRIPDSDRP